MNVRKLDSRNMGNERANVNRDMMTYESENPSLYYDLHCGSHDKKKGIDNTYGIYRNISKQVHVVKRTPRYSNTEQNGYTC